MSESPQELFRAAWNHMAADGPGAQLERMALESLAFENEELRPELERLTAPTQAVIDLILDGAGVGGHETSARFLGRLMSGFSTATKEVGKSIAGIKRLPEQLLVAAPAPGSVRLQFRAPDVKRAQPTMTADTESIESIAMRQVVALIIQAEGDGDQLPAAMSRLKGPARQSVKSVASTVVLGEWDVSGRLHSPTQGVVDFVLTRQGASRLVLAASQLDAEVSEESLTGVVDGWTWSTGTMRFLPATGQSIAVAVEPDLQADVATFNADHGRVIQIRVQVVTTYPTGDAVSARRSYSLLTALATDEHLTFDQQEP